MGRKESLCPCAGGLNSWPRISLGPGGHTAEDRPTFGDGILLVQRPQQLQRKTEESHQHQEQGGTPRQAAQLRPGDGRE